MTRTTFIIIATSVVVISITVGVVIGLRSSQPGGKQEMNQQPSIASHNNTLTLPSDEYVSGRSKAMKEFQERIYQSSKVKR